MTEPLLMVDGFVVELADPDAEGFSHLRFFLPPSAAYVPPVRARSTEQRPAPLRWQPTGCSHGEWPPGVTWCCLCEPDRTGVSI